MQPAGVTIPALAWRGSAPPLPDRFTLFMAVARDSAGGLSAVFRNPQLNSHGRAERFAVTLEGDSVHFRARPGPGRPEIILDGALDPAGRVHLHWPDVDRTLMLSRAGPKASARFYARAPGQPAYRYRVPPRTEDGWETRRAAAAGMDEHALERLVRSIIDTEPAAPGAPLIHALLIERGGALVLEVYFHGFDRDQPHDTRSASKTFASVMVGAAAARGADLTPATPIYSLLAREAAGAPADPRRQSITLGMLMTHTSGLACDDNDDDSPGNEDRMQAQDSQSDWWKYTLDLPVAHEPGTVYAYCSGGMNLVGAALVAATGTWLPALFDSLVARPLRFGRYYFNLMPDGDGYAGGGVVMLPRDLLKLGQVYLDSGRWRGRRIVTADWVRQSTKNQSAAAGGTDGFAWHRNVLRANGRDYEEFEANGNGGQFLIVVPELDLAVVFTAGNYGQYGIWRHFRDVIVAQRIIPAVR